MSNKQLKDDYPPWTDDRADELITDYEEAMDQELENDESNPGDSAESTINIGGKL